MRRAIITVVGRKKEMYVSGGENVYPAQVERILQGHAAVALAAVVGVPRSAKWGETGWAFVQLRPDQRQPEADLIDWCRQHLATFQCPSRFLIPGSTAAGRLGQDRQALAGTTHLRHDHVMNRTIQHLPGIESQRHPDVATGTPRADQRFVRTANRSCSCTAIYRRRRSGKRRCWPCRIGIPRWP